MMTANGSPVLHRFVPCLLLPIMMLLPAIPADANDYMVIGAAEVVPADNNAAYSCDGICVRLPPGGVADFQAPVQLPHGATIVTVTLEAHDEGGGEFGGYVQADLFLSRYFAYGFITQCTSGVVPAPGDTRIAVSANHHVVNNTEYSYSVHVRINNVTGTTWETQMFYKMIIEYTAPTSGVPEGGPLTLHQLETFPNPSSELVQVSYRTERDADVSGRVYDVSGRLVAEVFRGPQKAGAHLLEWDRRDHNGTTVAAGTYVLAVTIGSETISRKVVVIN